MKHIIYFKNVENIQGVQQLKIDIRAYFKYSTIHVHRNISIFINNYL